MKPLCQPAGIGGHPKFLGKAPHAAGLVPSALVVACLVGVHTSAREGINEGQALTRQRRSGHQVPISGNAIVVRNGSQACQE